MPQLDFDPRLISSSPSAGAVSGDAAGAHSAGPRGLPPMLSQAAGSLGAGALQRRLIQRRGAGGGRALQRRTNHVDPDYAGFHAALDPTVRSLVEQGVALAGETGIAGAVWQRLEEASGKSREWLEGYVGWFAGQRGAGGTTGTGTGTASGKSSGTTDQGQGEAKGRDPIFSQAAWYSSSGRMLTYDEVAAAVEVLGRYGISEGGGSTAHFLFDKEGKALGLEEFHLKFEPDKGQRSIEYTNNYNDKGNREQPWSYWFSDGKRQRYLKSPAMVKSGVPVFSKEVTETPVPADLVALDIAFIPGRMSCFRAAYTMDLQRGDQAANGGSVLRRTYDPTKREELLDRPLAAGHRVHVRTTGHSILVLANLGGDQYLIDDPGRNPGASGNAPEGTYSYVDGSLVRSDKNKTYPILEVESFK